LSSFPAVHPAALLPDRLLDGGAVQNRRDVERISKIELLFCSKLCAEQEAKDDTNIVNKAERESAATSSSMESATHPVHVGVMTPAGGDGSSGRQAKANHRGSITAMAVSPCGNKMVTSSEDQTAKVWSVPYGEPLGTLAGHTGVVSWCAWSSDGDTVVTVSHDKTVKVWSSSSLECIDTKEGHVGVVRVCAISPDGFQVPKIAPNSPQIALQSPLNRPKIAPQIALK